jgi:hypothetical protein
MENLTKKELGQKTMATYSFAKTPLKAAHAPLATANVIH